MIKRLFVWLLWENWRILVAWPLPNSFLASILGIQRTRDELIPYLYGTLIVVLSVMVRSDRQWWWSPRCNGGAAGFVMMQESDGQVTFYHLWEDPSIRTAWLSFWRNCAQCRKWLFVMRYAPCALFDVVGDEVNSQDLWSSYSWRNQWIHNSGGNSDAQWRVVYVKVEAFFGPHP